MMRASNSPICLHSDRCCPSFRSFTPRSVLFLLSSVCPTLAVLLSCVHFILPAWLKKQHRILVRFLDTFFKPLLRWFDQQQLIPVFNQAVFDPGWLPSNSSPLPSLPSSTFRAASPVPPMPGAAVLDGPPAYSPDTAECRTPYQRRHRTCGNKTRNQEINVEEWWRRWKKTPSLSKREENWWRNKWGEGRAGHKEGSTLSTEHTCTFISIYYV